MEIFVRVAQLLLSLSLLVIIHEFGHFMFAKLFKCRVEKFYLFFDPYFSIFKKKIGETEYGIGWLPLGGYVKISGMIDESMDKEQMKQEPQPWEFRSKPAWQRLLVMIGGVLNNVILACVIYTAMSYVWGESYLPNDNVKYGVQTTEISKEVGIHDGDKIISIDGTKIDRFSQINQFILLEDAQKLTVKRDGELVTLDIPSNTIAKLISSKTSFVYPRRPFDGTIDAFAKNSAARNAGLDLEDKIISVDNNRFQYIDQVQSYFKENAGKDVVVEFNHDGQEKESMLKVNDKGFIGVQFSSYDFELATIHYSFFESIPRGMERGKNSIVNYLKQLKLMGNPDTGAYKSVGGFISIGKIFPTYWDWYSFWNMTALLSIILAVMNILPIPALDGGHVLFLLFEIITRRKPNEKFLEYAQTAGMFILLALLLYANGNDIIKLIFN
ncbi:RIP metalloprotease RseP [Halosquirtibacter xylanolyticus]|uniref:RIP metalloprotease RseP n=1 Tax=Halosquirtibacter xylanolyticus TaxID=3374599 RepID=UPI003749EE07|nr:RIP metalloprotease RseP [Prolixibacteraceae bacterium]